MEDYYQRKEFKILKYITGKRSPLRKLQLSTQQLFVARWMNLGLKKSCFLKHNPGTGKTICALYTAKENLELYKLLGYGKIIIIGYQKKNFIDTILEKPDLEYLQPYEYNYLKTLSNDQSEDGQEKYKKYVAAIKKKMQQDGYILYFGYQELHNLLFIKDKTTINNEILALFSNSFVICDEIHNVYNSLYTNIYGDALNHIFNYYSGREDEPKKLLMSATPINNKPSEIIDIINLLRPELKFKRSDFFSIKNNVEFLLPGALERIKTACDGYFSVYINEDLNLMPKKNYIGDHGDYLKYIKCDISGEHQKIFDNLKSFSIEDHNLYDIFFKLENGNIIYKSSDYASIKFENTAWREKLGIDIINDTIGGEILNKTNIRQYSEKYFKLLEHLEKTDGKTIIYHEYVNGSGVKLIENLLQSNGYLSKNGIITQNTKCSRCGIIYENHKNSSKHNFEPVRYLSLYGELDKKTIDIILRLFNSKNNIYGQKFKILIGSEKIREGINFYCIQNIYIMHLLPHISAFLQLIGRAVRMMSHHDLPKEKHVVNIKIFAINQEIEQYEKKIQNYRIVQEIEQIINENAIDIYFYHDVIKASFVDSKEIGTLAYAPKNTVKSMIKLDTYNVFYSEWEIGEIKKIINSLFIISPAWSYEDLWNNVKSPPFRQFVDCSLFQEDYFKTALGDMIYGINPTIIIKNNIRYKIMSVINKIIYYVIYPVIDVEASAIGKKIEQQNGVGHIDYFSWIMPENEGNILNYNITGDLLNLNTNYEEMKYNFFKKFKNEEFINMPLTIEMYNTEFHIKLIEESISYVFNILVMDRERTEYHEFYFKMLHFYSKIDIIIYANMLPTKYLNLYENYIGEEVETNSLLITTTSIVSPTITSFNMSEINKYLENKIKKAPANILPVGHFMDNTPKLYTTAMWIITEDYNDEQYEFIENDIIIGFYEKSINSINYKFKLRNPKHKIEQKQDKRELEKGVVCEIKHKNILEKIAKQLNIQYGNTNYEICFAIKQYLLYQELKDRNAYRKGKVSIRTRWCYMQYEKNIL